MEPIKVVVHGAVGKVGQVLVSMLPHEPEVKLVGAVDLRVSSDKLTLPDGSTIPFSTDLENIIKVTRPQVVIDFSVAKACIPAARISAKNKVNLVIGTTGLSADDISEIERLTAENKVGAVVASNFALGAVLMIHFAKIASKYMDFAEIIELHHNQKIDAPSGTALNTARAMMASRGKPFLKTADAKDFPSRGEDADSVKIHSVRLAGLMAHQEVLFGGLGQTLIIRHDTINRECYVPGVMYAVREVVKRQGLTQGLDNLLGL
jgi:4-hydroxy-tetrahydrodipicolinate reductase